MDRLGISEEMRDRILFVIRNHLEMVRYANKFDLEDPEVIDSFAQFVEGEQRPTFSVCSYFLRCKCHSSRSLEFTQRGVTYPAI